jgi:TMEM175 potassium channel family protein
MTMMGVAFGLLWSYASRHRDLLSVDLSEAEIKRRTRRFTIGAPIYALSIVVALFSAPACLVVLAALAVYYAVPQGGMMPGPAR